MRDEGAGDRPRAGRAQCKGNGEPWQDIEQWGVRLIRKQEGAGGVIQRRDEGGPV